MLKQMGLARNIHRDSNKRFYKNVGFLWTLLLIIGFSLPISLHAEFSNLPEYGNLGFSGNIYSTIADESNLYIGGDFNTVFTTTGNGALVNLTTEQPNVSFPKVNGVIHVIISDGAGGWYIGGQFSSVGGVSRANLAHILSDYSVDSNFNPGTNGNVYSLQFSGTTLYAAGFFSTVNTSTTRRGVAAFNTSTGVATNFDVNLTGGGQLAYTVLLSDSTLYVGGWFTTVNGNVTRNNIAAFDTATGTATSFNPNASNTVNSLALSGSTLYAGGAFTIVNGNVSRNRIAAFDTATGTATSFNPNLNTDPQSIVISEDGTLAYVAGFFTTVNGNVSRNYIAAFDTGTGTATSFNPNVNQYVYDLQLSGSTLYAGGGFSVVNGGTTRYYFAAFDVETGTATSFNPDPSDYVSGFLVSGSEVFLGGNFIGVNMLLRPRLAAINLNTGNVVTSFNPNINGSAVNSLALSGSTLYVGGWFTTVNGNVSRNYIAAFDTATGTATSFNPNVNNTVNSLALSGSTLYAGGAFTTVNGNISRNRIAAFDTATGTATSFNPNVNHYVHDLHLSGSTLYAGGGFTTVNGNVTRNRIAAFDTGTGTATSFSPNISSGTVYSLALSGSTLYAGGDFTYINNESVFVSLDSVSEYKDVIPGEGGAAIERPSGGGTGSGTGGLKSNPVGHFKFAFGGCDVNPNPTGNTQNSNGGTIVGSSVCVRSTTTGILYQLSIATWNSDGCCVDVTTEYARSVFDSSKVRNRLAAFNTTTGDLTSFNPNINSTVNSVTISGSTLYAGGAFTTVNGNVSRSRIAAFNTSTGTVTEFAPVFDHTVLSLLTLNGNLYVGGQFSFVGDEWRYRYAYFSGGVSTGGTDVSDGLVLRPANDFSPVIRINFESPENNKALSSIRLTFSDTSGAPSWINGSASSSELLDLAVTGGGVSLWKESGVVSDFQSVSDTQITLAGSPTYGVNSLLLSPASAPLLAAGDIYYIALKPDVAGLTHGNAFTLSLPTNSITTTGGSPTISLVTTQAITVNTNAPSSASGSNPPVLPSGLKAANVGTGSAVLLEWTGDAGDESYNIYQSTDNINFPFLTNTGSSGKVYTVTELTAGTTYYFKVSSVSSGGESAATASVALTPTKSGGSRRNTYPTPALTPAPEVTPPITEKEETKQDTEVKKPEEQVTTLPKKEETVAPPTPARVYKLEVVQVIKPGVQGAPVKELQKFLNDALGLKLSVDGKIGPKTLTSIKKWQKDNGLVPDGIVGPKTKAKIKSLGFKLSS